MSARRSAGVARGLGRRRRAACARAHSLAHYGRSRVTRWAAAAIGAKVSGSRLRAIGGVARCLQWCASLRAGDPARACRCARRYARVRERLRGA